MTALTPDDQLKRRGGGAASGGSNTKPPAVAGKGYAGWRVCPWRWICPVICPKGDTGERLLG